MSFFWFVFPLFVVLFAYFGDEAKTRNKRVSLCSRVLLLLLLSGVLATCGSVFTDNKLYADFYYYFSKTKGVESSSIAEFFLEKTEGIESPVENGFALLMWVIGKLHFSHIGFFFIIGAITNYFIIKAFYRFRYPTIIFLTYILSVQFQQEFNLVRQMMAVAILFYSLKLLEEHDWKKYLLTTVIAFTIHQSAIIALLFIPLFFVKNYDKVWKVLRIVFSVLLGFSLLVALKMIPFDISSLTLLLDMYEGYLSNDDSIGAGVISINYLYNFVVILTLCLYKANDGKLIYILYMVLGCIINNLSIQTPNLNRLALFFSIAYLALTPMLLGNRLFEKKIVSNVALTMFTAFNIIIIIYFIVSCNNLIGTKIDSIFNFFQ